MLFLPEYVKKILIKLKENGYEGYAVGGCVRDIIMNTKPNDYDVTTNALPEVVEGLFKKTIPTGIKHGTVTVMSEGHPIEVTTFRTEFGYSDSRRPDKVKFVTDIKDDLSRRDFTVNAIAYDENGKFIDPFDGRNDINLKILRAVGEPKKRFQEDALRILRLFRFASQLQFTPESCTLDAALSLSGGLKKISCERIANELIKALCGNEPDALLPLLNCGALEFIGISSSPTLSSLKALPKKDMIRLAAFIILCKGDAQRISKSLKLSNEMRNYIIAQTTLYSEKDISSREELKYAMFRFGDTVVKEHLIIKKVLSGVAFDYTVIDEIKQSKEPYTLSMLAINGKDLLNIGIQGEEIGKTLNYLLEAVISTPPLNTKEKLIEIITKLS